MKLIDKDAVLAEIEKLCEIVYLPCNKKRHGFKMGFMNAIDEVIKIFDSMQEDPVSEELEKAAESWIDDDNNTHGADYIGMTVAEDAFKAGANWQKEQDKQWLAEEHKNIFAKGRESMKVQMMKDAFVFERKHNIACVLASECLRNHGWFNTERDFDELWQFVSGVKELFQGEFKTSDKRILTIIKED